MLRFGDFEFDPDSGDLRHTSGAPPPDAVTRLAPQPAKLLALLLDRGSALLDREEIRRALWPETHVDFDQSLAFCVRQLRAALGDSAATPTYIETLPRRGFRLLVPVQGIGSDATATSAASQMAGPAAATPGSPQVIRTRRRGLGRAGWLTGLLVVAVVAGVAARRFVVAPGPALRLAIMPFELAASESQMDDRSRLAQISEWLMVELARAPAARLAVIGPRTTAAYHGAPFPDLVAMARDLEVDYALNCRFLADTEDRSLIVELIRLEDGGHPWVERFDGRAPWRDVAKTVRDGVRRALDLPS